MTRNQFGKKLTTKGINRLNIYLDCSGAICQEEWIENITYLVETCYQSKSNIKTITFHSFSHQLSKMTKFDLSKISAKDVIDKICRIQKQCGGTDFDVVWLDILKNKKENQPNVIITDFLFSPWAALPTGYPVSDHYNYDDIDYASINDITYYMPITCVTAVDEANFCDNMLNAYNTNIAKMIINTPT